MTLAFAWGAFWLGCIAGPVALALIVLIVLTVTDEELKKDRAVRREMDRRARAARQQLYEEQRQRVRREMDDDG